jgi:hypothetical protein
MIRRLFRRRLITLFALIAGTALIAAACVTAQGALQQTSLPAQLARPAASSAPAQPAGGPALAGQAAAPRAAPAASSASDSNQAAQTSPATAASTLPLDRMVMRTAKLSLQVGDVEQALTRTREIAQAGGGFLSGTNTRLEQDRTVADLTLQVRADALDATLNALRGLGKVESETSSSQDVTEEYVDLDANLRNLQASESAILKLMDRAQRIEDVISLQRELTNVRGQIERIQGRKTFLERRTDMATVSVSLRLPPVDNGATSAGGFDPLAVARRGWTASLNLLRGVAEVVIMVAAFSWWLVPLLAIGLYVYLHRRPQPTTPAQA